MGIIETLTLKGCSLPFLHTFKNMAALVMAFSELNWPNK